MIELFPDFYKKIIYRLILYIFFDFSLQQYNSYDISFWNKYILYALIYKYLHVILDVEITRPFIRTSLLILISLSYAWLA